MSTKLAPLKDAPTVSIANNSAATLQRANAGDLTTKKTETVPIILRTRTNKMQIEVNLKDTVLTLKETIIVKALGVPVEQQALFKELGEELDNKMTLEECGIHKLSTVRESKGRDKGHERNDP